MSSHPHSSITNCRTILSKAQHKQVHFVLSAPADTEAESFRAFLQLHREVIIVLWKGRGLLQRNPAYVSSCYRDDDKKSGLVVIPGV